MSSPSVPIDATDRPIGPEAGIVKTVLYHSADGCQLDDLLAGFAQLDRCRVERSGRTADVITGTNRLRFVMEHEPGAARAELAANEFDLVLLDLRDLTGQPGLARKSATRVQRLLETIATERDVEKRFGFHRVLALVAGSPNREVDALLLDLGAIGVERVLRGASAGRSREGGARAPERAAFYEEVLDVALETMTRRSTGSVALCCAGGGITGIHFEIGALKCLDDCLSPGAVNRFDLYFGISAGAVVTSLVANGYTVDQIMAVMAGHADSPVARFDLSLFRRRHLNLADYQRRLHELARQVGRWLRDAARGQARYSLDALLLGYTDVLAPPFHGQAFERYLRKIFRLPGSTNDFRQLPNRLYLGATDQDAHRHVLFGDEGWDDVPISLAVQASMSINPAFRSTEIRGRFYEDGAVTRTTNFIEAIRKGAGLVFVINPFLPFVSKEPGFAEKRGIWFNVDQNIRTATYTRFENHRSLVLRHYPHVSSYTFLPANRLRKVMGLNPLDHRPYLAIWRGAYLSTLHRIQQLRHRLTGDAAGHGLELDTRRAEQVAAQLEAATFPQFEDFFPDRKVALCPRPALAARHTAPSRPPALVTAEAGSSTRPLGAPARAIVLELAVQHPGEALLEEPAAALAAGS